MGNHDTIKNPGNIIERSGRSAGLVLTLATSLAVTGTLQAAGVSYSVTGIAPFAGDNYATAEGINNSGQVIGWSTNLDLANPGASANAAVNGYIFQGAGKTLLPDFGSAAGYPSANTPFAINDNG